MIGSLTSSSMLRGKESDPVFFGTLKKEPENLSSQMSVSKNHGSTIRHSSVRCTPPVQIQEVHCQGRVRDQYTHFVGGPLRSGVGKLRRVDSRVCSTASHNQYVTTYRSMGVLHCRILLFINSRVCQRLSVLRFSSYRPTKTKLQRVL